VSHLIRLNSIGYLPDGKKTATILFDTSDTFFYVKNADSHTIRYSGVVSGPYFQEDVHQKVWIADFSGLEEQGKFYIEIPGRFVSTSFVISDTVYKQAFKTVFKGFYLLRCGAAVKEVYHSDTFYHKPCHTRDGWLTYTGFGDSVKDGTGGWHDAGDYGKYTVNAGITLANLFMAWEYFGTEIRKIDIGLPETAPEFPEYLQELKWETDFLLKMQYSDSSGRVSHKLTGKNFEGFIMPGQDTARRYFSDWGSNATANFAAVMAMSARYFERYDRDYAKKCLNAARLSYGFLQRNPGYKRWGQKEIWTGGYQANDKTARIWAAAELWEATGGQAYLTDFENRAKALNYRIDINWDWGNVSNLAMFTYLLSEKQGRDEQIVEATRKNLLASADTIVRNVEKDIYGRPFTSYYWGCNGTVARLAITLYIANQIKPDVKYVGAAQQIVAHLFGRNYYGRSFVTGLGENPPMFPHDRRSGSDKIIAPWPGYIVGGGHSATDWVDEQDSYSRNEIAINWQAALVFALSWFTHN
jgi:endoglucanase